jgi:UDP-N-acetylglucosamine 2-epimerase (non-hydrolysing)
MKILSIVGARPQFIKCAPLSHKLRERHEEIIVHTGQHYDSNMSNVFFEELNIPEPDYNLGIGSGLHGKQTALMIIEIEKLLMKEQPNLVLVYGDTNSTLAGALAASKLHIKIAHVEAGLRSFDRTMPEEINRILTDHLSSLLFCPTDTAIRNLKNEGITSCAYNVGDVMVDSLNYNLTVSEERSTLLKNICVQPKEYMVATIHRPVNTDNRKNLSSIVEAFCKSKWPIVFPVHPRTEKCLRQYELWDKLCLHVKVIQPAGYLDMLNLMAKSKKILTDSGGVQKEAYMLGVPCITLRESTEWIETVYEGWNVLVGANYTMIKEAIDTFDGSNVRQSTFGRGKTAEKIVEIISSLS